MNNEKDLQARLDRVMKDTKSIAEEIRKLADPVDMDELEAKGLIEKKGAWYKVNNFNDLPEGLRGRAIEIKQSEIGTLVKFSKTSKYEKLAKKFEKLGFK